MLKKIQGDFFISNIRTKLMILDTRLDFYKGMIYYVITRYPELRIFLLEQKPISVGDILDYTTEDGLYRFVFYVFTRDMEIGARWDEMELFFNKMDSYLKSIQPIELAFPLIGKGWLKLPWDTIVLSKIKSLWEDKKDIVIYLPIGTSCVDPQYGWYPYREGKIV